MKRDTITQNSISEPSPPANSRTHAVNEDRMALDTFAFLIHWIIMINVYWSNFDQLYICTLLPRPREGVARYCYLAPGGGCEVLFSPYLSVCLCVRPIFWYFYFSAISRDIDLKFIHDTYRVVLNSLKQWAARAHSYHRSCFNRLGNAAPLWV